MKIFIFFGFSSDSIILTPEGISVLKIRLGFINFVNFVNRQFCQSSILLFHDVAKSI